MTQIGLAQSLRNARNDVRQAVLSVEDFPKSLEAAYRIAYSQVDCIAAWKVGGVNAWSQGVFNNTEPFFGPLSKREVFLDTNRIPVSQLLGPRAEPEIALRLGDMPPEGLPPSFSHMGLAIEFPSTVLPEKMKSSLIGQICDRAGAGFLWIGNVQKFDEELLSKALECKFGPENQPFALGSSYAVFNGPLSSAHAFYETARKFKAPIKEGQWIATGGMCPAKKAFANTTLRLRYDTISAFEDECRLELV